MSLTVGKMFREGQKWKPQDRRNNNRWQQQHLTSVFAIYKKFVPFHADPPVQLFLSRSETTSAGVVRLVCLFPSRGVNSDQIVRKIDRTDARVALDEPESFSFYLPARFDSFSLLL